MLLFLILLWEMEQEILIISNQHCLKSILMSWHCKIANFLFSLRSLYYYRVLESVRTLQNITASFYLLLWLYLCDQIAFNLAPLRVVCVAELIKRKSINRVIDPLLLLYDFDVNNMFKPWYDNKNLFTDGTLTLMNV